MITIQLKNEEELDVYELDEDNEVSIYISSYMASGATANLTIEQTKQLITYLQEQVEKVE